MTTMTTLRTERLIFEAAYGRPATQVCLSLDFAESLLSYLDQHSPDDEFKEFLKKHGVMALEGATLMGLVVHIAPSRISPAVEFS